jgi:hypothetical protein
MANQKNFIEQNKYNTTNKTAQNIKNLEMEIGRNNTSIVKFNIRIPENFFLGCDQTVSNDVQLEFIPKNETVFNWTEIFTVIKRTNCNIRLIDIVKNIKSNFSRNKCECIYKNENGRNTALIICDTEATKIDIYMGPIIIPGKKELIVHKVYCGMNTVSDIQYTIRYDRKITPEETLKIKDKILKALDECIVISEEIVPK